MVVRRDSASWGAVCVVALFAACGGSVAGTGSGGSLSVSGQLGGGPVPTNDVVGLIETQGSGSEMTTTAGVAFTNVDNTCAVIDAIGAGGPEPSSTRVLSISVTAAGNAVAPGTYSVVSTVCAPNCAQPSSGYASATYSATDANCKSLASEVAASGTVVLTRITTTRIDGSFDVTMAQGEHVTGSFSGPVCIPPAAATPSRTPTCR